MAEERKETLQEKAARLAAERAESLVSRALEALALRDARGVQSLCSAALTLVPGHPEAELLISGHPHGWDCMCDECKKGVYPASKDGRVSPEEDAAKRQKKGRA